MSATERVVNDLNTAKLILCNHQMLTPEMCIRIGQAITDAISLLKEQEELLRKLQKDKDRLCLEVSEWKHKFYDAPPKFVPQGIVDQIVFERDTALSQLEQLGKGLGSTFLMRELSDNR